MDRRLRRSDLPVDAVALALLLIGKILEHDLRGQRTSGRIVETALPDCSRLWRPSPHLSHGRGGYLPMGVDELTWVGAIAGHRVPVIKGPVTGLPIPADGEIVIEGDVIEGDTMMEGPLGEFTDYYAGGTS